MASDVATHLHPSPPPLPSLNDSASSSTSSSSTRTPSSTRSSSPSGQDHTPTPASRAFTSSSGDLDSIPFEDIVISDAEPVNPVNGKAGGSGGAASKRSSWQQATATVRAHSPRLSLSTRPRSSQGSPPPGHSRNGSIGKTVSSVAGPSSDRNTLQVSTSPTTAVLSPSPLSRSQPLPDANTPSASRPNSSLAVPSTSSTASSSQHASAPPSAASSRKPSPNPSSTHKSSGPSAFEKVMSKTRPVYLPPKDREEDQRHLKAWEQMMKTSATHEKQRKLAIEQARAACAAHQAAMLPTWTEQILKSPRTAVAADPRLRAIWFEGIPPRYRGDLWERVGGNGLGLSSSSYASHVKRFEISLERQTFPKMVLVELERDAASAYPGLKLFKKDGGAMYAGLREFLGAWVVARSDEGLSYCTGVHLLAATLLLNMPPQSAWKTLLNLLSSSGCLRAFYDPGSIAEQQAYYRVLNTLCADALPKVYYNLMSNGVKVPESWFRTMFVEQLPFDVASRVWDQIFLDGDSFIFRTCLALLRTLEHRLYDPDASELLAVLSGRSHIIPAPTSPSASSSSRKLLKAEMVTREVSLSGGEGERGGGGGVYGVEEGRLFRELEEGKWKEGGFERLVRRELDSI